MRTGKELANELKTPDSDTALTEHHENVQKAPSRYERSPLMPYKLITENLFD